MVEGVFFPAVIAAADLEVEKVCEGIFVPFCRVRMAERADCDRSILQVRKKRDSGKWLEKIILLKHLHYQVEELLC